MGAGYDQRLTKDLSVVAATTMSQEAIGNGEATMILVYSQSFWLSVVHWPRFSMPSARAEYGWVAVAGSPSREALDWDTNVSQEAAVHSSISLFHLCHCHLPAHYI